MRRRRALPRLSRAAPATWRASLDTAETSLRRRVSTAVLAFMSARRRTASFRSSDRRALSTFSACTVRPVVSLRRVSSAAFSSDLREVLLVLDLELVEVDVVQRVADLLLGPQRRLRLGVRGSEARVLEPQLVHDGVLRAQVVLKVLEDALGHDFSCVVAVGGALKGRGEAGLAHAQRTCPRIFTVHNYVTLKLERFAFEVCDAKVCLLKNSAQSINLARCLVVHGKRFFFSRVVLCGCNIELLIHWLAASPSTFACRDLCGRA